MKIAPGVAILADIVQGEFCITQDGCENIVKIVRNTAGQGTNGFHLLRLTQLRFEPLALGDVPPGAERPLGDVGHISQSRFGLDDIVHRAGLDGLDCSLLVAMAGHHDTRIIRGTFIAL
jgi:hypothetical protein